MNGPDYIVEIEGLRHVPPAKVTDPSNNSGGGGNSGGGRPWIAVTWKCCSVYSRVYRNREGTSYEGRCPKCAKPVKARVGPGGTDNRFFEAG